MLIIITWVLLHGMYVSTNLSVFFRIIFTEFENHSESEVVADPNFAKYMNLGRGLENYFAVAHPSQPNYVAGMCSLLVLRVNAILTISIYKFKLIVRLRCQNTPFEHSKMFFVFNRDGRRYYGCHGRHGV